MENTTYKDFNEQVHMTDSNALDRLREVCGERGWNIFFLPISARIWGDKHRKTMYVNLETVQNEDINRIIYELEKGGWIS